MNKSSPLEKDIEKSILQYLEHLPGCFAWKNHTAGYFDSKTQTFKKQRNKYAINGVSDILGVYKGQFLAIEVKRPSNNDRPLEQVNFIHHINTNGGKAFFASSLEEAVMEMCK